MKTMLFPVGFLLASLCGFAAFAGDRFELLGDSATMVSTYGAKQATRIETDYWETPCIGDPDQKCEGRRFAWTARPSADAVWNALSKIPAKSEDVVAQCRIGQGALVDCVVETASGAAVSARIESAVRILLAEFKPPSKDLAGVPLQDVKAKIPFRWLALKAALDGQRPLLKAKIKPFNANWKRLGATGPYTPDRADRWAVPGTGILDCSAKADGILSDCSIAGDYPQGFGFGEASLRLFQEKLISVDPPEAPGRLWVLVTFAPPADTTWPSFLPPRKPNRD